MKNSNKWNFTNITITNKKLTTYRKTGVYTTSDLGKKTETISNKLYQTWKQISSIYVIYISTYIRIYENQQNSQLKYKRYNKYCWY